MSRWSIEGYLGGGDTKILLPGRCELDPSYENAPIVDIVTSATNVRVFRVGRDYLTYRVVGGCLRYNQGDAEWWAYNWLKVLGESGLGTLCVEDRLHPNCFFAGGTARITWGRISDVDRAWVDYELTFVQGVQARTISLESEPEYTGEETDTIAFDYWGQGMPIFFTERSEAPVDLEAWSGGLPFRYVTEMSEAADPFPDETAEYEGRSSNRTYAFNGTSLGLISDRGVEITARREVLMNPVSRCYGVRIEDKVYGLSIELSLNMSYKADTHGDWNEWWIELLANQGDAPASLVGNGNTFENCHLLNAGAPQAGDQWGHVTGNNVELKFLVDLN